MRLAFILLLFSAIVANEVLPHLLQLHELEYSFYENPVENQTEKESQDLTEDESKINHLLGINTSSYSIKANDYASNLLSSTFRLTPYLEIHSPPPDFI